LSGARRRYAYDGRAVHTSRALSGADFKITVAGQPASVDELFGDLDELARLGLVIDRDWGAAGASTIILARDQRPRDHAPARTRGGRRATACDRLRDADGRPRETFRRLAVDDALRILETVAQ
jgi:hypothetical protein